MIIQIPSDINPSTLKRVLAFLRNEKVPFTVIENNESGNKIWSEEETEIIRQKLYTRYSETGLWDNMDDDARQDAVLLEKMLFMQENKLESYTTEETNHFLAELKKQLYAH
jgi:ABC-type phosphate transport system ATPase subunit